MLYSFGVFEYEMIGQQNIYCYMTTELQKC